MLNRDFREMLCALNDAAVEYIVVGAYALAAHGHPRATGDIDVFVRPSPENATRVLAALAAFGAPRFDLTAEDLSVEGTVFQIGVPPGRIDILTAIAGITYDDAWNSRLSKDVDGIPLHLLGRDALIQNKRAAGRPKDLADIAALEGRSEQKVPIGRKGKSSDRSGPRHARRTPKRT